MFGHDVFGLKQNRSTKQSNFAVFVCNWRHWHLCLACEQQVGWKPPPIIWIFRVRANLKDKVKTYPQAFWMFWRSSRECVSFPYLERPGKPRAPSMEKSDVFCLSMSLQFPATYRHNSDSYHHIFDHDRPGHDNVYVAWRCWLPIQDGGHLTGSENKCWTIDITLQGSGRMFRHTSKGRLTPRGS